MLSLRVQGLEQVRMKLQGLREIKFRISFPTAVLWTPTPANTSLNTHLQDLLVSVLLRKGPSLCEDYRMILGAPVEDATEKTHSPSFRLSSCNQKPSFIPGSEP